MMAYDIAAVFQWWLALLVVGIAAYPVVFNIFTGWYDRGYLLSKAAGLTVITFIAYLLGTLKIVPFSTANILLIVGVVFGLGMWWRTPRKLNIKLLIIEEVAFFVCLAVWAFVKAHEPSIHGLEKFMDYGFTKSILNSTFFPAQDMWFAGNQPINYYYLGHIGMAILTKLSGLNLSYTFNLMLAALFAFTATMSFGIVYQLTRRLPVSLLSAFIVTLGGNLQTIYAFTSGYTGDYPAPFWTIFTGKLSPNYWYANATRFIPFSIHEFPSYSFVVSDVHGHVLSLPFVLLALGILVEIFINKNHKWTMPIFYGFVASCAFMTNALDGPIYMSLFGLLTVFLLPHWKQKILWITTAGIAFVVTALPFLLHFNSFVSGIALNCPPAFLADQKFGPLIFEGIEKCQKSAPWMLLLLWGFFLYCGLWLIPKINIKNHLFVVLLFVFAIGLIIFPEFFYFKDIYPQHFRSNTMFKLGYQAFIIFGLVSGYAMKQVKDKLFWVGLIPLIFLVSIFPYYSIRSYFGSLETYRGLNGTTWLQEQRLDDYNLILWIDENAAKDAVVVEADGDSYTDYERISTFTGRPTIVGWAVHEWLWRGSYDVVAPRREEVRLLYEDGDIVTSQEIIDKYGVDYIVVGDLEREKFKLLDELKLGTLGSPVYRSGSAIVYAINPR